MPSLPHSRQWLISQQLVPVAAADATQREAVEVALVSPLQDTQREPIQRQNDQGALQATIL